MTSCNAGIPGDGRTLLVSQCYSSRAIAERFVLALPPAFPLESNHDRYEA